MNEFKGTRGYWKMFEVDGVVGVSSQRADIAHCSGFDSLRSDAEERANAQLIATAPKLLKALRDLEEAARQVMSGEMEVSSIMIERMKAQDAIKEALRK